jgi:tryptophan synthase alpha chain
MQNRITSTFEELAKKGEGALICYVVVGYPDLATSQRIIDALVAGGADIVEIGIPFSDPIADGPTIQAACNHALRRGTKPENALALATHARKKHPKLPLLFMTYANILLRPGIEKFMTLAKKSGIDGFIIPDLPFEEADRYTLQASTLGLSTVFLASPNTSSERLEKILYRTSGFLYLVSVFGVTGARSSFEEYTLDAIKSAKLAAAAKVPVAAGFGINAPSHVKYMISAGADAVIVGSAIIERISRFNRNRQGLMHELEAYARSLKRACKK